MAPSPSPLVRWSHLCRKSDGRGDNRVRSRLQPARANVMTNRAKRTGEIEFNQWLIYRQIPADDGVTEAHIALVSLPLAEERCLPPEDLI